MQVFWSVLETVHFPSLDLHWYNQILMLECESKNSIVLTIRMQQGLYITETDTVVLVLEHIRFIKVLQ